MRPLILVLALFSILLLGGCVPGPVIAGGGYHYINPGYGNFGAPRYPIGGYFGGGIGGFYNNWHYGHHDHHFGHRHHDHHDHHIHHDSHIHHDHGHHDRHDHGHHDHH